MSPRRALSYSDTAETRKPRIQPPRGPTAVTVLDTYRPPTGQEQRDAGLFATSVAIRQGWTPEEMPGELADVLGALGIKT